jgi:hypothetical protein
MDNKPKYNPDLENEPLENEQSLDNDDIKNTFANTNISSLLEKLTKNPDELHKLLHESVDKITPDMLNNAKKMLGNEQGQQILKSLQKKGVNPNNLKSKLSSNYSKFKQLPGNKTPTRKCIMITSNRQLKIKHIPINNMSSFISNILKVDNPLSVECDRLSIDIFKDKKITLWYDNTKIGKNKRATKIAGFKIAGDMIISMTDEDLNDNDFLTIEQSLSSINDE